jgi:hypothetical protein
MSKRPPSVPEETALSRDYRELQTPGSDRCPDPEALAALALNETPPGQRESLADHIVACRRCSESYQILARTHQEIRAVRSASRTWIAAAALVLLAAGAVVVWQSARRDEVYRGSRRSPASVVPADGASSVAAPAVLRWPAQPQAEAYRVKLFAADGQALWQSDVITSNQAPVPESVRSRLQAGKSYFWSVEVRMPLETQRLGPFSFTLAP